jgi:hypothetical protein
MNPFRAHLGQIREDTPSAQGCEECLQTGDKWARLRWQFALTPSMRPFGKTRQTASLPYHCLRCER